MKLIDKILYRLQGGTLTYSQTGEDVILSQLFYTTRHRKISYLDVGTNHPFRHNNTYRFYREGGRGVCIEPNPALCELIEKKRPGDKVLNIGISPGEDTFANFFVMSSHTLSTFSEGEARGLEKDGKYRIERILQIQIRNINTIIRDEFHGRTPDLVSIDVEGWNQQIVSSIDFDLYRPLCYCIETVEFDEKKVIATRILGIDSIFEMNDYSAYAVTPLNTIFVDNRIL